MKKIAIAITTRNRPQQLSIAVQHWKKHLPDDAQLFIVDDASYPHAHNHSFRFPQQAGIGAAKNACIKLLMETDADHFFLADDDCWPIVSNWHEPYIQSKVKHLSMTFQGAHTGAANGVLKTGEYNNLHEYNKPCGCLIYVHRSVIEAIGGFDPDYPMWGMEHIDFSNRIHNAGLTPKPYLDVPNSTELFHSMDYYKQIMTSMASNVKSAVITHNRNRFEENKNSKEYMPFDHSKEGVILASYFNSTPDGQRGARWQPTPNLLYPLINTCRQHNVKIKIFHDCLNVPDDGTFIRVPSTEQYSPNVYRWFIYQKWLSENKHDNVFMVDSTDVVVLRNPFLSLNPNRLYVGDEYGQKVENEWMRRTQEPLLAIPDYRKTIWRNSQKTLVNCGIVGGAYDMVMKYLAYRVKYHEKYTKGQLKSTDMAIFNYIVGKHFKNIITHGIKVNTKFKHNEKDNGVSFFKHK